MDGQTDSRACWQQCRCGLPQLSAINSSKHDSTFEYQQQQWQGLQHKCSCCRCHTCCSAQMPSPCTAGTAGITGTAVTAGTAVTKDMAESRDGSTSPYHSEWKSLTWESRSWMPPNKMIQPVKAAWQPSLSKLSLLSVWPLQLPLCTACMVAMTADAGFVVTSSAVL